jgi:DnaK suppressor protein
MTRTQFLSQVQQRLMTRRQALRAALSGDERLLKSTYDSGVGDEVDAAIAHEEAELRSQLAEVESRELVQIDRALEKLRAGNYGRCETCDKPITPMRLKYLPYAADCIGCARREERRDERREAPVARHTPVNRIASLTSDESEPTTDEAELEIG